MSSHFAYSYEKFGRAVHALATSPESIKGRLEKALYHISVLREINVPDDFHARFTALHKKITSGKPTAGEGTVQATINNLSEDEAIEVATDIVAINEALQEWQKNKS